MIKRIYNFLNKQCLLNTFFLRKFVPGLVVFVVFPNENNGIGWLGVVFLVSDTVLGCVVFSPNVLTGLGVLDPKTNEFEAGALVVVVLVTGDVNEAFVLAVPNENKDGVLDVNEFVVDVTCFVLGVPKEIGEATCGTTDVLGSGFPKLNVTVGAVFSLLVPVLVIAVGSIFDVMLEAKVGGVNDGNAALLVGFGFVNPNENPVLA